MVPGAPEFLHVELGPGGEDQRHVAEEGGGLGEAHRDYGAQVGLHLVTDLETVRA